jgi:hypothetical protein
MELYRSYQVLLFLALSSTVGIGQTLPTQSHEAGPPLAAQASSALSQPSYCSAIAAGDKQLAPISKLCGFASTYLHELPDFICQQTTTERRGTLETVLDAQIIFRQGHESYSHVHVNGQQPARTSEALRDTMAFITNGEFGSFLVDLFKPPIVAQFKFRKKGRLGSVPVAIYKFEVSAADSFWSIRDAKGRIVRPEFGGQIWLEESTGRLLKLEVDVRRLPPGFEATAVRTITDYDLTSLGEAGAFILPTKSESEVCGWGNSSCATNVLAFHDCQKFAATTRIVADLPEP